MHNHFGIDNDLYSKQFTQGNIIERMDPTYMEFFRLQQEMKMRSTATEAGAKKLPEVPFGSADRGANGALFSNGNLVMPITANDESEMLHQLKA